MNSILMLVIGAGLLAVLYGAVQTASLLRASPGNARMQEIAAAIQEGAQAYLNKQYTAIAAVGVVILIIGFFLLGALPAIGFLTGAILSGAAGFVGMLISVRANVRTAQAASEGLAKGLSLAFRSGAITGMLVAGFALIGVAGYFAILNGPQGHQAVDDVAAGRVEAAGAGQEPEVEADAEEREAGDQHPGDGAGAEGQAQPLLQAFGGRLRGPHVGPHRDQHPGEARQPREHGADEEARGRKRSDQQAHGDEDHHPDDGDGGVLPPQIGLCAFLDGGGDFLHARAAGRSLEQHAGLHGAVQHGHQAGDDYQQQR
jgi:hypothetical protein